MSTVDPNAPKPSRRRAATGAAGGTVSGSIDPRVEDASGGKARPRSRPRRAATEQPTESRDPLSRLVALDEGRSDDTAPAVPTIPVVRTTTVDAAIPTGPMPAVAPVVDTTPPPAPMVVDSAPIVTSPPPVTPEPTATAPVVPAERPSARPVIWRRTVRPRVRRVTRVLRHVDTWSVFKVALVFNMVAYLVTLTAAVLLWNVAYRTGTIDNVEKFFEQFGWESFEFKGGELYHNLWIAGLFVAVGLTGFAVFLATLFNLITDLVGGIRVSVLEEEVITRASSSSGPSASPPTSSPPPPSASPPASSG